MDCMTALEVSCSEPPKGSPHGERLDDVKDPRRSCRADDSAVEDRNRGLQRRDGVLRTATVLTTLHRMHVLNNGRTPLATPQQELL
jgi:hypothetical protein